MLCVVKEEKGVVNCDDLQPESQLLVNACQPRNANQAPGQGMRVGDLHWRQLSILITTPAIYFHVEGNTPPESQLHAYNPSLTCCQLDTLQIRL